MTEYRKQAHCTYHTRYHLVFVTKYRRKVLRGGMGDYLKKVLQQVTRWYPEIDLLEMNTDLDHVHILAVIPPRMAVADAVRLLKSNSARAMRQRFKFLATMYEHTDVSLWSDGYFVSTSGLDEGAVRRYIQRQGLEDKGQTKFVL